MTTYVYEYPSGGAKFYLQDAYVYPMSGGGRALKPMTRG